MNILHIANDFSNSNLYKHLVLHMDQMGIEQAVYSAVRTQNETQFNLPKINDIHIKNILKSYDRILYRLKIRKIHKDLSSQIALSKIDLVHAHTLYSDGGVALKLKKSRGIPYIVAVRSTDMNSFQKYRPDLRIRRNNILQEAQNVIFTSPTHRNQYLSLLNGGMYKDIEKKAMTIPNGIDPFFLEGFPPINAKKTPELNLLYVGTFIQRKNVINLIKAVKKLNDKRPVKLTLVGGGGALEEEIKAEKHPSINYLGRITDRNKLREVYRNHNIFVMVSRAETFGLVYIEALSQGLPVIHKKNDAIDGYFEEGTVAETVKNMECTDEIAHKINELSQRLSVNLRKECVRQAQQFSWPQITSTYEKIYNSIVKKESLSSSKALK